MSARSGGVPSGSYLMGGQGDSAPPPSDGSDTELEFKETGLPS